MIDMMYSMMYSIKPLNANPNKKQQINGKK